MHLSSVYSRLHEVRTRGDEMTRSCDVCGRSFVARLARARYCSGACRARAAKLRAAGVPVGLNTQGVDDFDPESQGLVIVTRRVLTEAGVEGTISGLLAITMAQHAVRPGQTATGLVACIQRVQESVAAALSSAPRVDALGEVLHNRDAKLTRAHMTVLEGGSDE